VIRPERASREPRHHVLPAATAISVQFPAPSAHYALRPVNATRDIARSPEGAHVSPPAGSPSTTRAVSRVARLLAQFARGTGASLVGAFRNSAVQVFLPAATTLQHALVDSVWAGSRRTAGVVADVREIPSEGHFLVREIREIRSEGTFVDSHFKRHFPSLENTPITKIVAYSSTEMTG
jgi:hypothetical protein